MNAIIYVYYRIKKINPNDGNIIIAIQFLFIILVHLLPIISIFNTLFHTNLLNSFDNLTRNDDVIIRRLIKLPILFSPLYILVYLFLHKNNERIVEGCKKFESMPKEERRKKNFYLWLYIICSFSLVVLVGTSSSWIPKLQELL